MSKFKKKQIHETCDLKRAVLLVREPSEAAGLATLHGTAAVTVPYSTANVEEMA